jgi:peptidylprolyl isomerase
MVPIDLSSTKLMPGLRKGLTGQQVGSRVLVAIPPADAFGAKGNPQAGLGPTDTLVYLIVLVSASTPLSSVGGVAVPLKAGLPTAIVDGAKPAQITIPKTAAPTNLVVQPLIRGLGAVVTSGQSIKIGYTGVLWKDGKKFDASSDRGAPADVQIGTGKVIPGYRNVSLGSRSVLPDRPKVSLLERPQTGASGSPLELDS